MNAAAEIELRLCQQAVVIKEPGEAMEVEVESAIHQSNLRRSAQLCFLFPTSQQIINLVCQRVTLILFEECLEGTLGVFLKSCAKRIRIRKRMHKCSLPNAARTDDCDEFAHTGNYKICPQFNCGHI